MNFVKTYFKFLKFYEFINKNYFLKISYYNIKNYIKDCNINFAYKKIKYKPYTNFQSL